MLARVWREKFEGAAPFGEGIGKCASGGGGFGFGGEQFEFGSVNERVAGGADEQVWGEFRAALRTGHFREAGWIRFARLEPENRN